MIVVCEFVQYTRVIGFIVCRKNNSLFKTWSTLQLGHFKFCTPKNSFAIQNYIQVPEDTSLSRTL